MLNSNVSKNKMILPVIVGVGISIIASFLIVCMCAFVAAKIDISDSGIVIMALISMALGVFFGGMISAKIFKEKGFLIGAINGFFFFLITTVISFAVSREPVTYITLIKLITFVLCSMLGGVIGVNFSKKRSF